MLFPSAASKREKVSPFGRGVDFDFLEKNVSSKTRSIHKYKPHFLVSAVKVEKCRRSNQKTAFFYFFEIRDLRSILHT